MCKVQHEICHFLKSLGKEYIQCAHTVLLAQPSHGISLFKPSDKQCFYPGSLETESCGFRQLGTTGTAHKVCAGRAARAPGKAPALQPARQQRCWAGMEAQAVFSQHIFPAGPRAALCAGTGMLPTDGSRVMRPALPAHKHCRECQVSCDAHKFPSLLSYAMRSAACL